MNIADRKLLDAVNRGDAEAVSEALSAGANPQAVGRDGRVALMRSALRGDEESLRLLLSAGADPRSADDLGRTCLMYAALGRGRCFSMLLAAGADPSALDSKGESALAYAAAAQFEPMIHALLGLGARLAEAQAVWREAEAQGWAGVAAAVKAWLDFSSRR